jgi:hypothetical protein
LAKLVDPSGEWAATIGRAFVAFGSIEHITVVCLREIPKDKIQRSTSSFRLTPRIDLVLELLEAHPGDVFERLAEKLSLAKSMAGTRNLIAHNPLALDFYEHADGTYSHKESIVSLRKERHRITLPELQDFAAQAEQLASDLYGCTSAVINSLRGGAGA